MIDSGRRYRQKRWCLSGNWIACLAGDTAAVVDVIGIDEMEGMRHGQAVEISSDSVQPDDGAAPIGANGLAYNLAFVVNAVGETEAITRDRFQILHATGLSPQEAVKSPIRGFGESYDLP